MTQVPREAEEMMDLIVTAAKMSPADGGEHEGLAALQVIRKSDGAEVTLLVLVTRVGEEYNIAPLAELLPPDSEDLYEPPGGVERREK